MENNFTSGSAHSSGNATMEDPQTLTFGSSAGSTTRPIWQVSPAPYSGEGGVIAPKVDTSARTMMSELTMMLSNNLRNDGIPVYIYWRQSLASVELVAVDQDSREYILSSQPLLLHSTDEIERTIIAGLQLMLVDVISSGIIPALQKAGIKVNVE